MKVQIFLKTSDALLNAAKYAAGVAHEDAIIAGLSDELREEQAGKAFDEVMIAGGMFIRHGELVVLELDTETMTCIVVSHKP